jgi:hypothetical protein
MKYYLVVQDGRLGAGVWGLQDHALKQFNSVEPITLKLGASDSVRDALGRWKPNWFGPAGNCDVHELDLAPGHFYPRVARPSWAYPGDSLSVFHPKGPFDNELALLLGSTKILMRRLSKIFEVVHPTQSLLEVFGQEIRNLLVLACNEVEAHWKAILRANGVQRDRPTTNDYVLLAAPLKLHGYSIALVEYPWLGMFSPFKDWSRQGKPTQDIAWYAGYNDVKHDYVLYFDRATLRRAIEAVAACVIMLIGQFGECSVLHDNELGRFFRVDAAPTWPASMAYTAPVDGQMSNWTPVKLSL